MFCRLVQKIGFVAPFVRVQQHRLPAICNGQIVRLIGHTARLRQHDEVKDDDFLFDLGGQSPRQKANKPTKPQSNQAVEEATASPPKRARRPKAARTQQTQDGPSSTAPKTEATSSKLQWQVDKKFQSFDQLKYFDKSLNMEYIRLPKDHKQFAEMMLLMKSKRHREKESLLLVEGTRLMNEAIEAGLKIKYLLFSKVENVEKIRGDLDKGLVSGLPFTSTVIRVPQNDLAFWSAQTTCPGIIALFGKPRDMQTVWSKHRSAIEVDGVSKRTPITIICDQIREPNNLGSLLRTCAAVACEKVIVLKGCADPWDSKALRGGCGAQFRTEIVHGVDWSNVAEHLPADGKTSIFLADNKAEQDDATFMPHDEKDYKRKLRCEKHSRPKSYRDVSFGMCKHVTLVIGGETEGVSSHAYDLMRTIAAPTTNDSGVAEAAAPANCVLQIPLGQGVESLNVGVATGILLFEIRQQLIGV